VVAGILFAVAFFSGGNTPNANASPASVISFFVRNGSAEKSQALVGAFAVIFLVFFAVALASRIRGGTAWLANGTVAGAAFGAVGIAALFSVQYVLGDNARYLNAGSASAHV
jgi:predicted permease